MGEGRIKGITIEINGDVTGLNKALESTNKELRSSQKQLNDVNRLLKLDPTNTELLAQKQRLLGGTIKSTKDKLDTLKKAEEQAAEKLESGGKEAQEQYEALRREIISTEIDLGKLEKQADDTEKALIGAGDDGAESIKDAGDATEDAERKVSGFGSAAKVAGVAAVAAFTAAAAAAVSAAKALVDMTIGGAEYADTVLTLSVQTGIAAGKLQEYMYAAELVDVSTETLTKSMAKNIKSMKSASDGSSAYADAYKQLGVSVVDANGSLRDGETVYWEAIDALGKIENETERDAIAMQLFGKSAQELNPLIEAGASRMQELGKSAQKAGYVISDDMLNAYGALDDQMQYLSVGAAAAKNALGTVLLPVLTDLAGEGVDLLGEFTQSIIDANGDISKMSDVVGEVLPKAIDKIMAFLPELIEVTGEIIGAITRSIADNFPQIIDAGAGVITSLIGGMVDGLPKIVDSALQIVMSITHGIVNNFPKIIDAGAKAIVALMQGLTKSIPNIIPAIVQSVTSICETLIDNLPLILDAALQLMSGLAQGLLDALPVLVAALPEIITGIVTFLLDSIPQIIDAGIKLFTSLVDALPEIIAAIVDAIPKIIDGIITALIDSTPMIIQAGIDLLVSLVDNLPAIITGIVEAIPNLIEGIIDGLFGNIDKIIEAGVGLFASLVENIPEMVVKIAEKLPELISGIVEELGNLLYMVVDFGEEIVRSIWEGIMNLDSWLRENVGEWASGIFGGLLGALGAPGVNFSLVSEISRTAGDAAVWGESQGSADYYESYKNNTSIGNVNLNINAPNVDNVDSLADLVADKINTDIINRQAVWQ